MEESARELKIDLALERKKAAEAKAAEDAAKAKFWAEYNKEHNQKQRLFEIQE